MKAVVFHDIGEVRLEEVDEPLLQEPTDAIVRLTASAICGDGSDCPITERSAAKCASTRGAAGGHPRSSQMRHK